MVFVNERFGRQHLKATLLLSVEHDVQVFLLDLISYKQLTLCMDSA